MNVLGEYYENAILIQWKETVVSNTVWFQHFEALIMGYNWCVASKLWFSRGQDDSYIWHIFIRYISILKEATQPTTFNTRSMVKVFFFFNF